MDLTAVLDCADFPCADVDHRRFTLPSLSAVPESIRVVMIVEAPPADAADWFWAPGDPFFWQTTRQALAEAGVDAETADDLTGLGIHLTTAVKCAKQDYGIRAATIANCAERILEGELALFPNIEVVLAMGDVAIKAINAIARRRTGKRIIPAGPTWRIRGRYDDGDVTVIPSYSTTGKSYLIEASKRKMIAEDLRNAFRIARIG